MKENLIAPRPRHREEIPQAPEGMVATRYYGQIVFVSERGEGEPLFTPNSRYTERQLRELSDMDIPGTRKPARFEMGGSW